MMQFGTADARRSDDGTWAERCALGVFMLVTPISYALGDGEADAVKTILMVNTPIALGAWAIFRAFELWRRRRAAVRPSPAPRARALSSSR